jgi:hypothetical protein
VVGRQSRDLSCLGARCKNRVIKITNTVSLLVPVKLPLAGFMSASSFSGYILPKFGQIYHTVLLVVVQTTPLRMRDRACEFHFLHFCCKSRRVLSFCPNRLPSPLLLNKVSVAKKQEGMPMPTVDGTHLYMSTPRVGTVTPVQNNL